MSISVSLSVCVSEWVSVYLVARFAIYIYRCNFNFKWHINMPKPMFTMRIIYFNNFGYAFKQTIYHICVRVFYTHHSSTPQSSLLLYTVILKIFFSLISDKFWFEFMEYMNRYPVCNGSQQFSQQRRKKIQTNYSTHHKYIRWKIIIPYFHCLVLLLRL